MMEFLLKIRGDLSTRVDKEEFNKFNKYSWTLARGRKGEKPYAVTRINGKKIRLSRLIMKAKSSEQVDHINGDRLDNRKCNLRLCTVSQNCKNKLIFKNNKLGLKGVCFNKFHGKYQAQIMLNYKLIHLGYFEDPKKAHKAYIKASLKYHGDFSPFSR